MIYQVWNQKQPSGFQIRSGILVVSFAANAGFDAGRNSIQSLRDVQARSWTQPFCPQFHL